MTRNLAILLFPGVELLDFAGPYEVFSLANRWGDPPPFNIFAVAEKPGPVMTWNGLSVNAHHLLNDCPQPHVVVVPGGMGTRKEIDNPVIIAWIKQSAAKADLVLSICTGALLLAKAGLLDGQAATTHHGSFDWLRQVAPKTTVHEDRRIVDNGKIVLSGGIAAGIDLALHVVNKLLGKEVTEKTASLMEYPLGGQGNG